MKIENWNGYNIRFIEKDNEWWAVAQDVCSALGLKQVTRALSGLPTLTKSKIGVQTGVKADGTPALQNIEVNIINEKDIYRLVFKSRKPEAEIFQDWIYDIIKTLRQETGLEGFEVFRMLDKEHQKETMKTLRNNLKKPTRIDFIKANTITNKTVSNKYGFEKMVKKADMTPQMLKDREPILENVVELMTVNDKYSLGLSIKEEIGRYYQ